LYKLVDCHPSGLAKPYGRDDTMVTSASGKAENCVL